MKTETSAGGVVVAKRGGGWVVLLMQDMNGSWTFPKGKIEKREEAPYTAAREVKEEVGVRDLTLVLPLKTVTYFFRRGALVRKNVFYFLFQATKVTTPRVLKKEGIKAASWVTFAKAKAMIGYPKTNIAVLKKAEKVVLTLTN